MLGHYRHLRLDSRPGLITLVSVYVSPGKLLWPQIGQVFAGNRPSMTARGRLAVVMSPHRCSLRLDRAAPLRATATTQATRGQAAPRETAMRRPKGTVHA